MEVTITNLFLLIGFGGIIYIVALIVFKDDLLLSVIKLLKVKEIKRKISGRIKWEHIW